MGILTRLQSFIFGGAVASAASAAIRAVLEPVRQHAWMQNLVRVLEPGIAARLRAQGIITAKAAYGEAAREGYNQERVDALTQLALRAPDVGELIQLIRRGYPTDTQIEHALRKAQYEPEWDEMIRKLVHSPLTPGELATAIHRGIMHGPDLIITEPPTKPGQVPIIPPSPINPVEQASWWGTSHEQLRVLVGITGLPLSLGEMLQLLNRGKVTTDDVQRAIAESNLRNEYMDVALNLRRHLLSPVEYMEGALRGWLTIEQGIAGAELSGLEKQDAELLYNSRGRPLPVHQMITAFARGGKYDDPMKPDTPGTIRAELVKKLEEEGFTLTEAHGLMDSVQESNIQPRFYPLALANKYTYPSAFVLRSLVQGGELTAEQGHKVLLEIGWPPELAKLVAKAWGGGGTATTDPYVKKAQTQLWGTTHSSYLNHYSTDAHATRALTAAGVVADKIPDVLALWKEERQIVRHGLTVAQIRKIAGSPQLTYDEAVTRLQNLGYDHTDLVDLLGPPPNTYEPPPGVPGTHLPPPVPPGTVPPSPVPPGVPPHPPLKPE